MSTIHYSWQNGKEEATLCSRKKAINPAKHQEQEQQRRGQEQGNRGGERRPSQEESKREEADRIARYVAD